MDDSGIVEGAEPAAAFAALSDPMRVNILQALWDAEDNEASFSELREAVGVADSGRFNYHLSKLVDTFVTKTDDGYRLTVAGSSVVGSLLAGAYTRVGAVGPVPVEEPCGFCGGQRTFTYDDERARIDCADCDVGTHFRVPPGVFADHDTGELPAVTERYVRSNFQQADDGFCPYCEGRIVRSLSTAGETPGDAPDFAVPTARFECQRCNETFTTDLGAGLANRAPVVAFFHDHGVDVRTAPLSRVRAAGPEDALVESEDPLRAVVHYEAGGERLTVTVDHTLEIVATERSAVESDAGAGTETGTGTEADPTG